MERRGICDRLSHLLFLIKWFRFLLLFCVNVKGLVYLLSVVTDQIFVQFSLNSFHFSLLSLHISLYKNPNSVHKETSKNNIQEQFLVSTFVDISKMFTNLTVSINSEQMH